jgi:hypothetical protein
MAATVAMFAASATPARLPVEAGIGPNPELLSDDADHGFLC